MMSDRVQAREFIVHATQHWTLLVIFCLAGSLSGWVISVLLPSTIHATSELYVGLNVSNLEEAGDISTSFEPQFENADDYKNWQMANLNALVFMDEILDETLSQLRELDVFWNGVSRNQLRRSLNVYWRNAGKWRLVAHGDDRLRTAQAVTVWENVIVERVHKAVSNAENLFSIEHEIEGLSLILSYNAAREVKLDFLNNSLLTRLDSLSNHPPVEPLSENDRWSIWQPVAQAELGVVWKSLAETFPAEGASYQEHAGWIEQALQAIELERQSLVAQNQQLESERAKLNEQYSTAAMSSLGLSQNLEVEKITTDLPQFRVIRPTSTFILIGMLVGFIAWIGYWLVVYSRSEHL